MFYVINSNFVIYEYKCHCDSRYVKRTSQRLQDRIKQHVPQWLRQQMTRPRQSQPHRSCKQNDTTTPDCDSTPDCDETTPDCDSAVGQHLLKNEQRALNYANKRFLILATVRSYFHLNLLVAAQYLDSALVLCRQKEFVYALKLL